MPATRPRHWLSSQLLAVFLAAAQAPSTATGQDSGEAQVRIACLGDSITFGDQIADREHSSYPGWLNEFLGQRFIVRNFGVGGSTLLSQADRPYLQTKAFRDAVAWQPDIAVVILGTNDTCQNARRKNWQHAKSLATDAINLIATLHAKRPDMRIILCSPPPMFPTKQGLKSERKADLETRSKRLATCALAAQEVARRTERVEYLELRNTLRPADVSDGVHPTPFGAERLARRIAEALGERLDPSSPLRSKLSSQLAARKIPEQPDSFQGFQGITFELPVTKGACRIFFPHGSANGNPWIWRARFFGHKPELDIALLERGFHLVYCDVSYLFGAAFAIKRYEECYELLASAGFNQRATMEGMSRGGLAALNWAIAHPDRVSAIYGDNPVVDIRSWPGGNTGKRSTLEWQRALRAFQLTEEQGKKFELFPAERLEGLAAAKVPLLLVLGTEDKVVPIAENGSLLAARYASVGGPVQIWEKPGNGHHPHGLRPVAPLLRAILRANNFPQALTTTASPSVEFRSGAGWGGDTWQTQVTKMRDLAKQNPALPIAFLGDSITQGLTGATNRLAQADGERPIDQVFGDIGAISLGLSGDRTEHLLYRLQHGAMQELSPQVIVLQIGVNNVVTGKHTANEVVAGIVEIIDWLRANKRDSCLLVCGPFPAGKAGSQTRKTIAAIRDKCLALYSLSDGEDGRQLQTVRYLDMHSQFLNEDGTCNANMRGDRIHITASGQVAWLQALQPHVQKLLKRR